MARGWESKSVEAQQDERERQEAPSAPMSAEARGRLVRQQMLELSLRRAQADLVAATQPGHRHMLERAIQALQDQLATL